MEESHSTVINANLLLNSNLNNDSENKTIEELLENYEKKNATDSINNFNSEHKKQNSRKEEAGHDLICTNLILLLK